MSFSAHIQAVVTKSNARIGSLFSQLKLQKMPLSTIIKVFMCYVQPLFEYGLIIWMTGKFSQACTSAIDATFTKFLKRYLNLPQCTPNSIIYYLTGLAPFSSVLEARCHLVNSITVPECLNGIKFKFFDKIPSGEEFMIEKLCEVIPSYFSRSQIIWGIPISQKYRRRVFREICDSDHFTFCTTTKFHTKFDSSCMCKMCGEKLHPYHVSYNFCKFSSKQPF